jgi:hypothetical protein
MTRHPLIAIGIGAMIALVTGSSAAAQDAESRRIDSTPRIVLRPPPGVPPVNLPGTVVEEAAPFPESDRDRRLDLELDLEARRDKMNQDRGTGSDYVALAACVVGSGVVLVAFVLWASKRRGR